MRQAMEGSDLRVHAGLRSRLPLLLWLLQMGIIFLWVHDTSPEQARTRRIADLSLSLLLRLLALTTAPIPGLGRTVELVGELVDEVVAIGGGSRASETPSSRPRP